MIGRRAVDAGFFVQLVFIGLASGELLQRRIDQRVALGGHDVPRERVNTRFERSLVR